MKRAVFRVRRRAVSGTGDIPSIGVLRNRVAQPQCPAAALDAAMGIAWEIHCCRSGPKRMVMCGYTGRVGLDGTSCGALRPLKRCVQ
jgi:hypothetical protein